jgi:hypothetical protein
MGLGQPAQLGVGVAVAVLVLSAITGDKRPTARPRKPFVVQGVTEYAVPQVSHGPAVDGELDDDAWSGALRSGPFRRDDGTSARPHSEARLVWAEGQLFVGLYAADDDVRAPVVEKDGPVWLYDSFQLRLCAGSETFQIDVSARGTVTDARGVDGGPLDFGWSSEARVAADVDGTIDDGSDRDEEWVIEMAIPLSSLHLRGRTGEHLEFSVRRCSDFREGGRGCGAWGTESSPLVLDFEPEPRVRSASIEPSP